MNAAELREAADDVERFLSGEDTKFDLTETVSRLVDAARTIALPILEGEGLSILIAEGLLIPSPDPDKPNWYMRTTKAPRPS